MPVVGTFERPELVYRRYVTNTYSDGLSPENTFRKHAGSRSGVPRTPQCEEGGISCRHDRINHPTMPSSRSYMKKIDIEKGSKRADARFRITVEETGPYLVYGQPPLAQQFIMPDAEGESWYFQQGAHFPTDDEPTALCRCGASKNKPYCDGAHVHAAWDPRLTADDAPLLDNVELTEGETLSMTDNPKYCVFARFCDAKGQVWNLVGQPENDEARELAIREASMCPSGRLMAWDNETGTPYEFRFEPSLGLIEDVAIGTSSGLWVRGGIPVSRESGETYEIRNRVVLCRCGTSHNKPYCDGTHASIRFNDRLEGTPEGETLPEKVY